MRALVDFAILLPARNRDGSDLMHKWKIGIIAFCGVFATIFKPILFVIDRLAEVDFMNTYLGAIGHFLGTGWGTFATVVGGMSLIAWAVYLGLKERRHVHIHHAEIREAIGLSSSPVTAKQTEWGKPFEAIESFADQTLVLDKNKWLKKLEDSLEKLDETSKKIAELERNEHKEPNLANLAANTFPYQESPELARQRRIRQAAFVGNQISNVELSLAWNLLRKDMEDKLESGELVAKGVQAPYVAGKGEAEIARHEWRLLVIDLVNERAVEKNGGDVKYGGLVLGKKT